MALALELVDHDGPSGDLLAVVESARAEADAIREQARAEGLAIGRAEGIEIARQEGWQVMRFEKLGRRLALAVATVLAAAAGGAAASASKRRNSGRRLRSWR